MPTISVCMVVKDEEQFLEQCLTAVKPFADEIIIVDTGSTDKTPAIAKKFTDKFFSLPWQNDFSKMRNAALQKATGDWILVVDGDEVFSKEGVLKVPELVKKHFVLGYKLHQRNYTDDPNTSEMVPCGPGEGFAGYTLAKPVRLFQNKRGIWYEGKVHEGVEKSILAKQGVIEDSGIILHHYKALKGKSTEEEKRKAYLQLLQQQLIENKDDAKTHYEIGLAYKNLGEFDKAIDSFKEAARLDELYRQPYSNLAEIYLQQRKIPEAVEMLQKNLALKESASDHYNLGLLYAKQKDDTSASKHLQRAIELSPSDIRFYRTLASLLVRNKKIEKAISLMEFALAHNPDHPEFLNILGLFFYNLGQLDKAITHFKKALSVGKLDDALKAKVMINLAESYVAKKTYTAALGMFEQVMAQFPDKAELLKVKAEEIKKLLDQETSVQ